MIKEKTKITGMILCLLLAGGLRAYAAEIPLVNTESLSLAEVKNLSINYSSDGVILRESVTGELVIKEYMTKDRPQYYAVISRSGDSLSIRPGRRPWFSWSWRSRVEIYLPQSFRENIRISYGSGGFTAETDLTGYRSVDLSVGSGAMFLNRVAAETLSVRVSSGELEARSMGGNSFISLSSGKLKIDELTGEEHRVKISSGHARIDHIRGTGAVEVSSGAFAVSRLEGDSSIEIQSGSIQIAALTGTAHRIRVSSGRITIAEARGQIEGRLSSGTLNLENFSGHGDFDINSGNINLGLWEPTGDMRVTVTSGDINLTIPRKTSFNLDASTNSGRISVDEGPEGTVRVSGNSTILRPFGPSPEITIYARTTSGSIRIKRS
ncbi:MAG: DUF4097 domain-containing protein [Treponema sp.]|jgi:DUF4097 and DUF4098 domain-containing protein YvlB|nr:DUF4097 domain-containing protein [Treponema sp.]